MFGRKEVKFSDIRMPYVKTKPMPEGFWRANHPILRALRCFADKPPRNVTGYHVQGLPDGCYNCVSVHCGQEEQLGCTHGCATPQRPMYCDEVHPLGKCDRWVKFEWPQAPTEPEAA